MSKFIVELKGSQFETLQAGVSWWFSFLSNLVKVTAQVSDFNSH